MCQVAVSVFQSRLNPSSLFCFLQHGLLFPTESQGAQSPSRQVPGWLSARALAGAGTRTVPLTSLGVPGTRSVLGCGWYF